MQFQKQDMTGTHYQWPDHAAGSVFNGEPSRRLFDRLNGHQVLFIINFYGSQTDKFTAGEGREIEYEISHFLPLEAKSEISVFNWIRDTARHNISQ